MSFGARWAWHSQRRAKYEVLLYRLNRVALADAQTVQRELTSIYDELIELRPAEGVLPGNEGMPAG